MRKWRTVEGRERDKGERKASNEITTPEMKLVVSRSPLGIRSGVRIRILKLFCALAQHSSAMNAHFIYKSRKFLVVSFVFIVDMSFVGVELSSFALQALVTSVQSQCTIRTVEAVNAYKRR